MDNKEYKDVLKGINLDEVFPKEKKKVKIWKWIIIGIVGLVFLYLLYHFINFYIVVGNIF